MRKVARIILGNAETAVDPVPVYEDALQKIDTIDANADLRLKLTKEYVLRILQFHQKKYEEMINRDLNSAAKTDVTE